MNGTISYANSISGSKKCGNSLFTKATKDHQRKPLQNQGLHKNINITLAKLLKLFSTWSQSSCRILVDFY